MLVAKEEIILGLVQVLDKLKYGILHEIKKFVLLEVIAPEYQVFHEIVHF